MEVYPLPLTGSGIAHSFVHVKMAPLISSSATWILRHRCESKMFCSPEFFIEFNLERPLGDVQFEGAKVGLKWDAMFIVQILFQFGPV